MKHYFLYLLGFVLLLAAGVLIALLYKLMKKGGGGFGGKPGSADQASRTEQLRTAILSSIEDGVMIIDAQKTIQMFNDGASKITGWPTEEAVKLECDSVIKLIDSKDNAITDAHNPFSQVFREAKTIRANNVVLVTRTNQHVSISLSVSPLLDAANAVTGAVAIFRDVSQEHKQEQQRAEFISTASHEMRTPVAAIEGYLALALNDKVATIDSKARDFLEKAHSSTQHLGQLFQDLLTSAKAEDGRLSNHPGVIEMSTYLKQLTEDLKFSAEKKGLFSEFILGSSDVIDASAGGPVFQPLYYVYADPDRMREVITNLFDNACKYTESGKVTIGLTGNKDVVQFYIKDTGHGIPPEDIGHLFQKFYRVDNSATRTIGGTGLGLFICRKIVELYNGHIWVDSEVGKGSTFFINLPRITTQRAEQLKTMEAGSTTLPDITSLSSPQ